MAFSLNALFQESFEKIPQNLTIKLSLYNLTKQPDPSTSITPPPKSHL